MSIKDLFKFKTGSASLAEGGLEAIFVDICKVDFFVQYDVETIYAKILTDCVQRTQGIPEKYETSLWDNCLGSESRFGLITLLAKAMEGKKDLFLVYKVNVLREATQEEAQQIKDDYAKQGKSSVGVFISFTNYQRTDMLKIFSRMEYSVLNSLSKKMGLSKAIQFKMSKMREAVGAVDSSQVIAQAKSIAKAIGNGNDVMLDGDDEITTSAPEMESTNSAIAFLDAKRSFHLGLPISYITGEQTAGIGSTGEADTRAVERGLRIYYISILKPVLNELFGIKTSFKSQDFRMITTALDAVKTFDLVSDEYLPPKYKAMFVAKLFDIDDTDGFIKEVENERAKAEKQREAIQQQQDLTNPNIRPVT